MHGRKGTSFLRAVAVAVAAAVIAAGPLAAQTLEEKIKEFELRNGMTWVVVERSAAPVVFCAIAYDAGAANEWPNITGISHMLEHMMFKGTEMMGTKNYKKELPYLRETDELGGRTIRLRKEMGEWRFERFSELAKQVLNAFTEEEKTAIGANKPEQQKLLVAKIRAMKPLPDSVASVPYLVEDGGVDYLEKYLEYETAWGDISRLLDEQRQYLVKDELWGQFMNNGSRFLNAFTSNDFTVYIEYLPANRLELFMNLESDRMESPVFREFWSERDVIMEERRLGENDPDNELGEAFYAAAFTAHPYRWPVVGWMSDLRTIDREELIRYHDLYYTPNNAIAIVVGDVTVGEVKKLAEKYFGSIPRGAEPPRVETIEPEQKGERRIVLEHTANPKLMIGYHKPIYPDPDAAAFDVIENVLANGRTSRFYQTVFEKQQLLAEEPNVYDGPGSRYDNLMVIEALPRNPHTLEEVEAALLAEIERLKSEPVTARELERVKNQIDAALIRQLGSNLGIAFTAGFGRLFYGDYRANFRILERAKQVTAEDVMRVAREYLTAKNRTVAYRVQVEQREGAGGEEQIDEKALMQYIQTLPQEEQVAIFQKFQSLKTDAERKELGKELWERAKAATKK